MASTVSYEFENEILLRSKFLEEIALMPLINKFNVSHQMKDLVAYFHHKNSVFKEIEVIRADGKVLVDYESTPEEETADELRTDYLFKNALKYAPRVFWEILPDGHDDKGPLVVFYLGIKNSDTNETWGALRAETPLSVFSNHLDELDHNDEGAVFLINKQLGTLLPLSDDSLSRRTEGIISNVSSSILMKASKQVHHESFQGEELLFATTDFLSPDWVSLAAIPADLFFAVQNRVLKIIFIVSILLAFLGGCLALLFGRKIVTPINRLETAVNNISSGKLEKIRSSEAPGELKTFLVAFNNMISELESTLRVNHYIERIFDSMKESLLVISLDGKIEKTNKSACSLLGYKEEELIGCSCMKLFSDSDEDWLNLLTRGKGKESQRTFKTKSGSKVAVKFSWSRFSDQEGKTQGIVCIFQEDV